MRLIRVGLCSVNSTVGAVRDNGARVQRLAVAAAADGCTVAAFPEQVLGGYPPEDSVQWRRFVQAQLAELCRLARETAALPTVLVVGALVELSDEVYNCAAVLHRGRLLGIVPKEKLPLYNVFYEARTLSRGTPGRRDVLDARAFAEVPELAAVAPAGPVPFGDLLFACDFGTMAVEVCEDLWSPDGPQRRRCFAGAELVVNLSASPYRMGVCETRRELINTRAADNNATVAYVNLVGANDGLVFDGGGLLSQNGRLLGEAPRFREGLAAFTADLDRTRRLRLENTTWRSDRELWRAASPPQPVTLPLTEPTASAALTYPTPPQRSFFLPGQSPAADARRRFCEDLLDVMALGIGDYFQKTGAFRHIGVALSGGRDSLLCLILAHRFAMSTLPPDADEPARRARAAELLRAFYMPTRYSSSATLRAAEAAAADLGVPLVVLPIEDAFEREAEAARRMLQPGEQLTRITIQNIQSRLRAQRMWNWSNAVGGLFLQTGNMSEKAVGYTTVGGDLMGALAPIANLPKTVVNYVLDYLLEETRWEGIRATLVVPASAELAEDQEDERDLMPFPVLDSCFALFAGEKLSPDEITAALAPMFPEYPQEQVRTWVDKFTRLFTQSIYKWVQSPLSIHVGNLDLERERALQIPVVARAQWLEGR